MHVRRDGVRVWRVTDFTYTRRLFLWGGVRTAEAHAAQSPTKPCFRLLIPFNVHREQVQGNIAKPRELALVVEVLCREAVPVELLHLHSLLFFKQSLMVFVLSHADEVVKRWH